MEPISSVGLRLEGGSRMTNGTTIEIGEGLEVASVGCFVGSKVSTGSKGKWWLLLGG